MRAARTLALFALLPLFAACQMFDNEPAKPSLAGMTRMQGELTAQGDKLLFQPCNDKRNYVVNDTGGTSILQEAASLAGQQGALVAGPAWQVLRRRQRHPGHGGPATGVPRRALDLGL